MFKKINRTNTKSSKWDIAIKKYGNDVIALNVADSEYETSINVKKAIVSRAKHGAYGYNYCDKEYYDAVINWYLSMYGLEIAPEWILPTMGVVFSVNIITKLAAKSKVLIQTPVYHHFFKIPKYNNLELVINKLEPREDTYFIDFVDLEEKLKTVEVFILCNPQNPVGRVWSKEELEKIVMLCKKYNVFLISDEVHADIMLFGNKFTSVGNFFMVYDNIALVSSPSKTFNVAGLQTANIIIKNSIMRNQINKYLGDMIYRTPNIFGVNALVSAYTIGSSFVIKQNKHIEKNYLYLKNFFSLNIPLAKVYDLQATYLVWIDFSYTLLKSSDLIEKFSEYKVLLSDGSTFINEESSFVRINIACPFKVLKTALQRINECIKNLP